ncbi:MAG: hypothetical protein PHD39_07325 [Methylobacter tundripaludum]|nr:hypothetical protein [Methylobacter tundripaludum]
MTRLLHNFTVSEIYYFVRLSVENAHLYYKRGRAQNKKHAGNTIPNRMLNLGEKAMNEQWKKFGSGRDSMDPTSAISKVFYNLILREEDTGFNKSPGKHWENEIYPRYFYSKEDDAVDGLCCNECLSKLVVAKMVDGGIEVHCQDCGAINEFISNRA